MGRFGIVLLSAVAAFAFALFPKAAQATICTIPYVFTTGATINAAPFNSNFATLQTCANNIDNTNIGANGIYASQVIPTSMSQATFGGSQPYTFSNGLTVVGPINLTGNISISGALAAVGEVSSTQQIVAGFNTAPSTSSGDLAASENPTTGAIAIGGYSSSARIDFNGTNGNTVTVNKQFFSSSSMAATSSGGTTIAHVPPMYSAAGADVSSNAHLTFGTGSCTLSANTCTYQANFSSQGSFTNVNSYGCGSSITSSAGNQTGTYVQVSNSTASQVNFTVNNGTTGTPTLTYVCWGF